MIIHHVMDYKLSAAGIFIEVDNIVNFMNTFAYGHEWENVLLLDPATWPPNFVFFVNQHTAVTSNFYP